ncbi:MAG: aminotransferase class I/II-fold pyridoxal phosphate-dependent enzyme [Rhodospirillales bacterium]|nr:aminotransferase class I/II-fold pyridoxal phosphate-dependent enzyme [Rhodospirillales bacterium]
MPIEYSTSDHSVSERDTLAEAATRLDRNPLALVFVTDPDGRVAGRVTPQDVEAALSRGAKRDAKVTAAMAPVGSGDDGVLPVLDSAKKLAGLRTPVGARKIPIAEPTLGGNELRYVTECVETNWISSQGSFVRRFEAEFAARLGVPHALAVSNGTVALHLALAAFGIGPGDEVIVPDLTFAATINAVVYTGATPVIVDIAPDTWSMDSDAFAAAITPRTKAVIPVHLYGQPADMDPICAIAKRRGIFVVEDAAEAVGSKLDGTPCGAIGDCGTFSFYSNKLITTGEGGMVVFKDDAVAARARMLRDHGMNPAKRYWHDEVGFNYRLTNLQAAIGCAQLEQIDGFLARKKSIAARYLSRFAGTAEIECPHAVEGFDNSFWVFSVAVDRGKVDLDRDALIERLSTAGIDSRPLFYCLHEMPPYRGYAGNRAFPVAKRLSDSGLSLPSSTSIRDEEIDFVAGTFKRIVAARRLVRAIAA